MAEILRSSGGLISSAGHESRKRAAPAKKADSTAKEPTQRMPNRRMAEAVQREGNVVAQERQKFVDQLGELRREAKRPRWLKQQEREAERARRAEAERPSAAPTPTPLADPIDFSPLRAQIEPPTEGAACSSAAAFAAFPPTPASTVPFDTQYIELRPPHGQAGHRPPTSAQECSSHFEDVFMLTLPSDGEANTVPLSPSKAYINDAVNLMMHQNSNDFICNFAQLASHMGDAQLDNL